MQSFKDEAYSQKKKKKNPKSILVFLVKSQTVYFPENYYDIQRNTDCYSVSCIYQIVAPRLALAALGFLRLLKTGRLIAIYSSPSSCRLRENSELSFLAEDVTSTLIISWDFNRGWGKSVPEGNKVSTQRLQVKERGWDPTLARPQCFLAASDWVF